MAGKVTLNGAATQQAIAQNPGMGVRPLARLLQAKHPKLFPTFDDAKSSVAYHKGLRGNACRKKLATKKNMVPKMTAEQAAAATQAALTINRLPASYAVPRTPYQMTTSKTLVLCDVHIPYQDNAALAAAIDYGVKCGCTGVVLLGDILDCHELSDHEKDPEARTFKEEKDAAVAFLSLLREKFPAAKIVYRQGNHEARMQRYLGRNAPALLGCEEYRIDVILKLFDQRIDWVDGKRRIKIGPHFSLFHGDEYPGQGGVNPARSLFLKSGVCAGAGHNHRTTEHTDRNADDGVVGCWSFGCLCDLHPLYMPYNKWNHGFGIVDLAPDGNFKVHNHKIIRHGNGTYEIY
jgi:predicted phosphodiesterase